MEKVQGVTKQEIVCLLSNAQFHVHNSVNCVTQKVTDFVAEVSFLSFLIWTRTVELHARLFTIFLIA